MSRTAVGRGYPLLVLVLLIAYYTLTPIRPLVAGLIALVAIAAIGYGLAWRRPAQFGGWGFLAVSVLLVGVGNVLLSGPDRSLDPKTFPSAADVCYLLTYLPLAIGLLWLGRPRFASHDWPMLLDTIALSLAGSTVIWIVLVRPAALSLELTGLGRVAAVASGVGFVAVLASAARVLLSWRRNMACALLSLGVAAFLLADFRYGIGLTHGDTHVEGQVGLGYFLFCALAGGAALMPDMSGAGSTGAGQHQLGAGRLSMLAVALLIGPSALLAEATSGPVTTGVAIAVVSAAVGIVMVARLAISGRALRLRVARERAFGAASRTFMVATSPVDVQASLAAAVSTMVGPTAAGGARLVEEPDPAAVQADAELSAQPATAGDPVPRPVTPPPTPVVTLDNGGELVVPLAGADPLPGQRDLPAEPATRRWAVFTGRPADLAELAPILAALADQAGLALARIDLSSELRAQERERYFRSLVLTSRDVTLICRNGRIDYATPSARPLFQYDVRGQLFDTVVRRGPATQDAGTPHPADPPDRAGNGVGAAPVWSSFEDGVEGFVEHPDGTRLTVEVHRRDLSDDPTVAGVVTTLRDVTAERDLQRALAHRASHDGLTGLANAEQFRDQLRADRELARPGRISAVLFVDLDDFKAVNDTHGHEVGDGLLITVGHRIRSVLRTGDLAARLGGDEFAVLLRDVPDVAAAQTAAERIADGLARPAVVTGVAVDCRASIGLALATGPDEYDTLLRHADMALYTAKAAGKGSWREYRPGMPAIGRRRADLRAELETAIREEALTLHYQPVVELATGALVGFEALVRVRNPGQSTLDESTVESMLATNPASLVRLAEDHGLIVQLGDWVLGRALTDARRLNTGVASPVFVGVNVSAIQLRQPGFTATTRTRLAASGVDPSVLVMEITESLLLKEDERAWSYLTDLRADGIRVAIDDYGTGYASLSYLRQPGIDIVKIDASFLRETTSTRSRVLLEAVITLTGRLELDQIAEGIEDEATRDLLVELGCRYGQGFLYAEPMPIEAALTWRAQP